MHGPRESPHDDPGRGGGVVAAHALLSSRDQVIDDRRALYRLAVSLVGGIAESSVVDVDHPVARFRIGEMLAGRLPASRFRLPAPVDLIEHPDCSTGRGPSVVGRPNAAELLMPALRAVAAEAGVSSGTLGLITRADGARFAEVSAAVAAGLDRADELVPELMADLLGHVALIGVLDPQNSGTVVSASSRHVPGLVLLRPGVPLEIAESLIHEAAHQRLFDLAITRDLLRGEADAQAGFGPSWRPTRWPVEQTLAAFHAYACLTELADAVPPAELDSAVGPHSVLPEAARRFSEIGHWLDDNAHLLGSDAVRLVRALLDRPSAGTDAGSSPPIIRPDERAFRAQLCQVVPASDGRYLVGVPGDPPRLFWLDADTSTVLRILRAAGPLPLDGIVLEFDRVATGDAFARVSGALDTLVLAELAAVS